MSAEAVTLTYALTASGTPRPVCFKVTRRVDTSLLAWHQRWLYGLLCRRLPESWRVPPVPPMERGVFLSFAQADAACTSRDDQVRVLPLGWSMSGEELDSDIVCRPRDRSDESRYHSLRERYGDECEYDEMEAVARISEKVGQLTRAARAAL